MHFTSVLDHLYAERAIEPLLYVAIHAGVERRMEYGTQHQLDYKGPKSKANAYTSFIFDELLPFTRNKFGVSSFKEKYLAGFSLGGLSALDIVWNRPEGSLPEAGLVLSITMVAKY